MMKRCLLSLCLLILAAPCLAFPGLRLTVKAGDGHGRVRMQYVYPDCGGDNISPPVHWTGAPAATRSFVLTTFDPDANDGAGWWHWLVIDLPPATHALREGAALPEGARSLRNDFGQSGWGGPCPPRKDPPHHYVFTLYALDVAQLPLGKDATPAQMLAALHGHVLAKSTTRLIYGR